MTYDPVNSILRNLDTIHDGSKILEALYAFTPLATYNRDCASCLTEKDDEPQLGVGDAVTDMSFS